MFPIVSSKKMCYHSGLNHSFLYFSVYPFTGTTQGCGNGHNVVYNVSVKLQMSDDSYTIIIQ
jgi:hypothetical protein